MDSVANILTEVNTTSDTNRAPAGTTASERDNNIRFAISTNWRNKENLAESRLGKAAHAKEFYEYSLTRAQITQKILDGYRVAPGTFTDDYRKADNWQGAQAIALDYDESSVADLRANPIVGPHAFLIHSSASSGIVTDKNPDGGLRSRVWLLSPERFTDPDVFEMCVEGLYLLIGLPGDENTKNAATAFYGSTNRAEAPHFNYDAALSPELVSEAIAISRRERERQQTQWQGMDWSSVDSDGDLAAQIVARAKARGWKGRGKWINGPCLYPENHKNADSDPSAGIAVDTGVLNCFTCGKHGSYDNADRLVIDISDQLTPRRQRVEQARIRALATDEDDTPDITGLPDSIRSALLKYCEPTTAPAAELITTAVAMGLIDPAGFDIPTLMTVKSQVSGFDSMTESTLRRAVKFLMGLFLSELETIGGSLVSNSGRNAKQYAVRPSEDFLQAIERQAAKRIYERHHPVEETDSLSPILTEITPGMVSDSGFDQKAADIAREANERLAASDWHRNDSRQAKSAAKKELARLRQSLRRPHSTPLPAANWSQGTAKDYRAAYRRALHEAQPHKTMTRREQMDTLGIQNGSLKTLNANAGLAPEPHFERLPVADVVNLEARVTGFGREIRGFPKLIVAETASGDMIQTVYQPDHARETIKSHLSQGRQVAVEYQTANTFAATSDGPPERAEPARTPTVKPATKPSEKHYGPTYDPRWLTGQYLLGLEALGWQWVGDMLIDIDTGETVDRDTPPKALLSRILDMPLPDKLLDYAARLPGVIVGEYDRAACHQSQRRNYPVDETAVLT